MCTTLVQTIRRNIHQCLHIFTRKRGGDCPKTKDCWIEYGVIITSSCHNIGNGAVIGAGTILTRNVEPYSVVVGNPGRKIRSRFNNETIELLELSKWFDLEPTEFLKFYNWINSPKEFAIKIMNANNSW